MRNEQVGITELISIYKKHIKNILTITLVVFILSIIYSIISTPLYKSYISLYPQHNQNSSFASSLLGVDEIASTLGLDIGNESTSGFNVPDIVNSRRLKKAIVAREWRSKVHNTQVNLIDYWELDKPGLFSSIFKLNGPEIEHLYNIAIEKLTSLMSVYKHESGMITISLLMEDEIIASEIVNFISDWIENYVSNEMMLKATKNRQFIEERLDNAKNDLFLSEEKWSDFQKNHSIADDNPDVLLQKARLLRNIEVNQQVYITLRQQFELNRIEELKERPVINILDVGEVATEESKPLRILIVLSSTLIAFILSGFFMYCYDGVRKNLE